MTEPLRQITKGGGLLDAAPLKRVIKRDAERCYQQGASGTNANLPNRGLEILANESNTSARRLYAILDDKTKYVTVDVADAYLCNTGRHLRDLWPWLYSPEQIEADVAATDDPEAHRKNLRAASEAADSARRKARTRIRQALHAGFSDVKPDKADW